MAKEKDSALSENKTKTELLCYIRDLENKLEITTEQKTSAYYEIIRLQKKLASALEEKAKLAKEKKEAELKIKKLELEIDRLSDTPSRKKELEAQLAQATAENNEKQKLINELETKLKIFEEMRKNMKTEIDSLHDSLNSVSKERELLTAKVADIGKLTTLISEFKKKLQKYEEERKQFQSTLAESKTNEKEANARWQQYMKDCENLEKKNHLLNEEKNSIKVELGIAKKEIEKLAVEREKSHKKYEEIEQELVDMKVLKKEKEMLNDRIKYLERQMEAAKQKEKIMTQENYSTLEELEKLKQERIAAAELKKYLETKESEIKELKKDTDSTRNLLAKSEAEKKEYQKKLEQLGNETKSLQMIRQRLETELTATNKALFELYDVLETQSAISSENSHTKGSFSERERISHAKEEKRK